MLLLFIKSVLGIFSIIALIVGMGLGFYKAVQYIEDRTYAAKKKIEQIIICTSLLHFLLLFRGISFFLVVYSLCIQGMFYGVLSTYPDISPTNPNFLIGSFMALLNHFLFLRTVIKGNFYILEVIAYFAGIVWLTPFCFFLSLSANDEALPSSKGKKRATWIGSLLKKVLKTK